MKNLRIVIVLFFSVLIAQPGSDVPETMSFQGLLTDSDGVAYEDGSYDLTFRLIRELTDGSDQVIWEENHSADIANGVFSIVLGYVNPLPLNISPNVQLETQVGDEILSPRQALTSVPFALKSSPHVCYFLGPFRLVMAQKLKFRYLIEIEVSETQTYTKRS